MVKIITVSELKELMQNSDVQIIDVRGDDKVAQGMIPGAKHIRKDTVASRLSEIDKSKPVYVNCNSGNSSLEVASFLETNGYDSYSLDGGYQSWVSGGAAPLFT